MKQTRGTKIGWVLEKFGLISSAITIFIYIVYQKEEKNKNNLKLLNVVLPAYNNHS